MRRHMGLKAPTQDLCVFCAACIRPEASRGLRMFPLSSAPQRRSFRAVASKSQQSTESPAWKENTPSFPFQPSPFATGNADSRQSADRRQAAQKEAGNAEKTTNPFSRETAEEKKDSAPRQHRQRHSPFRSSQGFKIRKHAAAVDMPSTNSTKAGEPKASSTSSSTSASPSPFPDLGPVGPAKKPDMGALRSALTSGSGDVTAPPRLPTAQENQRRDEIMRRMAALQKGATDRTETGPQNDTSSGTSSPKPLSMSKWRTWDPASESNKLFGTSPTTSRRNEKTSKATGPRDALSDLVDELDDPFASAPTTSRTRRSHRKHNIELAEVDPVPADLLMDEPPRKPKHKDRDSERHKFLRSRGIVDGEEEGFSERKPRQRRQFDDDIEEEGLRRRGGRRVAKRNLDEDFDSPRSSRRRERDLDEEAFDDVSGLKQIRDKRQKAREAKARKASAEIRRRKTIAAKRATALAKITLPQFITVSRLAQALSVKLDAFTRKMEALGFSDTAHDHVLSAENASLIALEFNFDPSIGSELEVAERDLLARPTAEDPSVLPARPPIVTIMGHVDHGKTTILDFLRKSSVAASEHGGITQHIGAFSVKMSGGKLVTFLDTPGHAAFLSMRKRGATVTDIVVLVVAADDSVKPQTLEALKHAREANVPIIVAVNKVDKPEADVQRVKQDLARHNVEIEDFGGDVQVVPVSGKTGQGMPDLEEAIVTLGEILDQRAEDDGLVEGWILEATTKAAGRVATVLVRRGTLKQGSVIVAGQTWARVRSLQSEAGVSVESAGPGTPVEVDGWRDQPMAGDMVLETDCEQKATDVVDYRVEVAERQKLAKDVEVINEARRLEQEKRDREKAEAEAKERNEDASDLLDSAKPGAGHIEVPFIIKADVSGSAEAVEGYLQQLINPICSPKILRAGVGAVSEFDIEHASAAKGHIITFNLSAPPDGIAGLAVNSNVKIIEQNVIYRLLEQVKSILEDQLEPTKVQRVTGEAEVLKTFDISLGGRKKLRIAGSRVRNGEIKRNSRVRVLRNGEKIYDGTIDSLKNVKKDVTEMRKGTECGIGFEDWTIAQEGDQIQTYEETLEKRSLPV